MVIKKYVTVVQRRHLTLDDWLCEKLEHLFEIETHMSMEERVALFQLAMMLPQGFIACEVGSFVGASASFLAAAADIRGGHLHCVDTWDCRAMWDEVPRDTLEEFQRNTRKFSTRITMHRGESSAMAAQIPAGLNLLFIDGDHSYEATLQDLQHYAPLVKRNGVLLLHDYDCDEVRRATQHYLATRPSREAGTTQSLQGFQLLS